MTGIHELQNLLDELRAGNRIRGRDVNRQSREPVLRPIQALVPLGRIVPLKRWHRLEVLKKLSTSFVDSNFRRSFRELCPLSLSLSGEEELEEECEEEREEERQEIEEARPRRRPTHDHTPGVVSQENEGQQVKQVHFQVEEIEEAACGVVKK